MSLSGRPYKIISMAYAGFKAIITNDNKIPYLHDCKQNKTKLMSTGIQEGF